MTQKSFKKVTKFSALGFLLISLSSCNKGVGCPTWSLETIVEKTSIFITNILSIF